MFSISEILFAAPKGKTPDLQFPSRIHFIENKNQWDDFIRYEADFKGGKIFLENNRFSYVFCHPGDMQALHPHGPKQPLTVHLHAVKITPVGANAHPEITANDPAGYFNNYFIGNDPAKWAADVRLFTSVTYNNLYGNIDLKYYSSGNNIKYDFIVREGGDPGIISLSYEGADHLSLENGALQMKLSVGTIAEEKPYAYQLIDGKKTEVSCRFVLDNNRVSFHFPRGYNKSYPLVIDPTLVFASYTGSSADNWGFTATYDAAGNVYAGGNVNNIGYPVTPGAYQLSYGGGGTGGNNWDCDMAIAKFNDTGTSLLFATYLGGSDNEQPQSLVVDGNDDLIIFGIAFSTNYPVTAGAYQTTKAGNGDMVISKLSPNGNSLLGSTYLGGGSDDGINISSSFFTGGSLKYNYGDEARGEIIADAANNYIVGSCSKSTDFPTTIGVMQSTFGGGGQDGVLFKINNTLTSLDWSTYIGGNDNDAIYDCTLDNNGNLFLAGGTNSTNFPVTPGVLHTGYQGGMADGFISHITGDASSEIASTYIGTPGYDQTYFVELDYSGNVYTTGQTEGSYPITPGVYSNPGSGQFIHKMNADLTTTFYSTVFGSGTNIPNISPTAFLVDTCENVYVAGWGRCISVGTSGSVFGMPVTPNAFQSSTDGCDFYFFVLNHDAASVLYATYYGGALSEEHVDGGTSRFNKNGTIYESVCAGCGGNDDFPTTPGVVSSTNNSNNCNNGVIKLAFNLARTVSSITTTPNYGCAPFSISFINNSINASAFEWDFGDGSPTDTTPFPTHTYLDSGIYHVRLVAFNDASCNVNDTAYANILVKAPLPVTAAYNLLQHSPCDTIASVQSISTGGNICSWDFGDGYTTTGVSASHTYSDTGTYIIRLIVSDTICTFIADTTFQEVTFHSFARARVAATGSVRGCAPFAVTFNNNSSSNGDHFWEFHDGSPTDTSLRPTHVFTHPGVYDVIYVVSDPYSCNLADTAHVRITVPVSTPLFASFDLQKSPYCDTLRSTLAFNGTGGNIYHWYFGDGQQAFGDHATHYYSIAGTYNVVLIATDTVCDLVDSSEQVLSFRPFVEAGVSTHGLLFGCAPQLVELSNAFTSIGSHTWYFGDGTMSSSASVHHTYNNVGTYHIQLVVSDTGSCNKGDTAAYVLHVYADPKAAFTYENQPLHFSNNDIHFFDRSSNAAIYRWNFGDGAEAYQPDVAHRFASGGSYDVCLYVTSLEGCLDSTCVPIDIFGSEAIYVPTAFTPNGDGTNDEFRVFFTGLTQIDVIIFNRWGEKIYEYNTLDGSWDGTYNGKPVAEDVYVWRLQAKGVVNDDIVRYGRVSLVK